MTKAQQLELWLKGESVHDDEYNECCPDFSCCKPHLEASQDEKEAFVSAWRNGDGQSLNTLMMWFLETMLRDENPDKNIVLINGDQKEECH